MSGSVEEHPLLAFKPPACSAIEYLCIVQDQLDLTNDKNNSMDKVQSNLRDLNKVMDDAALLEEIGWDLVTFLLPLVPESEYVLKRLFAQGNAKEIALKSCIVMQNLFKASSEQSSDQDSDDQHSDDQVSGGHASDDSGKDKKSEEKDESERADVLSYEERKKAAMAAMAAAKEIARAHPAPHVVQFAALLRHLPKLFSRLLVRFTSRFAGPVFQAVLGTFERASLCLSADELVFAFDAACNFLNDIPTDGKPRLPPRDIPDQASTNAQGHEEEEEEQVAESGHDTLSLPAPAEEAPVVPTGDASKGDAADEMQVFVRLVQSFAIRLYSTFVSARATDPVSLGEASLGWAGRVFEHHQPKSSLPGLLNTRASGGRQKLAGVFTSTKKLAKQDSDVTRSLALVQQRGVTVEQLLQHACTLGTANPWHFKSDEPPRTADEIRFMAPDAVVILAVDMTYRILAESAFTPLAAGAQEHDVSEQATDSSPARGLFIYPHHADMFMACTSNEDLLPPVAVTEALLAIGLDCLYRGNLGHPANKDVFPDYFMRIAQIAACSPSPMTRFLAHKLLSGVILQCDDEGLKLSLMRSTLTECPFPNLRESAVGWFKEASLMAPPDSLFGDGTALKEMMFGLFPKLCNLWAGTTTKGQMDEISNNQGLFLASLNLYRLLVANERLRGQLNIKEMHKGGEGYEEGAKAWFLDPLLDTVDAGLTSLASLETTMANRIQAQSSENKKVDLKPGLEKVRGMMLDLDLVKSLVTDVKMMTHDW